MAERTGWFVTMDAGREINSFMRKAANATISDRSRPAWQTFVADADVILRPRRFGGARNPVQEHFESQSVLRDRAAYLLRIVACLQQRDLSKSQANRINGRFSS